VPALLRVCSDNETAEYGKCRTAAAEKDGAAAAFGIAGGLVGSSSAYEYRF
jgi:hypothetical protein